MSERDAYPHYTAATMREWTWAQAELRYMTGNLSPDDWIWFAKAWRQRNGEPKEKRVTRTLEGGYVVHRVE